jgi:hypothetical protein
LPSLLPGECDVSQLRGTSSDDLRMPLVVEVPVGSSLLYGVLCVDARSDVFSSAAMFLLEATGLHSSFSSSIERVDIDARLPFPGLLEVLGRKFPGCHFMFAEIASLKLQAVGVGSNVEQRRRASNLALALAACWNGSFVPTGLLKEICDVVWPRRERLMGVVRDGQAAGRGKLNAMSGILRRSKGGSLSGESVGVRDGDCDVVHLTRGMSCYSSSGARGSASQSREDMTAAGNQFGGRVESDVRSWQELTVDRSGSTRSAVEETHAGAHSACGCDCDTWSELWSWQREFPFRCECTRCGLCDGSGKRRCSVGLSPIAMLATAHERGMPLTEVQPCYCGDCREFCLLEGRRSAVKRARLDRDRAVMRLQKSFEERRFSEN